MKFFYGGSIQGGRQKCGFGGEIIDFLKDFGVKVEKFVLSIKESNRTTPEGSQKTGKERE